MVDLVTPRGRGMGRKPATPDGRDIRYGATHEGVAAKVVLPASVDLRQHIPAVWDQGQTSSCGAHAGAALLSFLFPHVASGFSREDLYYKVRVLEGDVDQDAGVETRDVMKVLESFGGIPETAWPFNAENVLEPPPPTAVNITTTNKLGSYARLLSEADYLGCLASGFPFLLGFMVPESLDGDEVDATGIMTTPAPKEKIIGGHDVLVVGYATGFRKSPLLQHLDPKSVEDTMLLIRNSWGATWSKRFHGHFWMPISWALNPTTGGDAWTGRVGASMKEAVQPIAPTPPPATPAAHTGATPHQVDAAKNQTFASIRKALNEKTSYGSWVSDEVLRPVTDAAAVDIAKAVVAAG